MAAITIPSIIANYTREATSAKLKKFYSTISQASMKSKADGVDWEDWAVSASSSSDSTSATTQEFAETYLLPYINYTETKTSGSSTYVYLMDGTYFRTYKGGCLDFIYDTNGDKKPNTEGRDIFRFLYCPTSNSTWIGSGRIIPYQKKTMKTRETILSQCQSSGMYCSALWVNDNFQFKEDYPYNI